MSYKETEPIQIQTAKVQDSQAIEDAQTVLISLGYEKAEIKSAMSKASSLISENASAEEILKETLKILSL